MISKTLRARFYSSSGNSENFEYLIPVMQQHSYEIFQFLDKEDLNCLKCVNRFFFDLCDCHSLFTDSIEGLQSLFIHSLKEEKPLTNRSKSKFKDKFDFNKSMNEFYKGSDILEQRIQTGKKKK